VRLCVNTALRNSIVRYHGDATVTLGTRPCITQSLKDAFECLGGIKILLPLITQLDMPLRVREGRGWAGETADVCVLILALFCEMLHDSVSNQVCRFCCVLCVLCVC